MKPIPRRVVFLAAKRTPFGTYGGSLKDQSATDLGVHAAKAAIAQAGVKPEDIDKRRLRQRGADQPRRDLSGPPRGVEGRSAAARAALTVNRLWRSGFQAVVRRGAGDARRPQQIARWFGGAESMSQAPHVARGLRFVEWGWASRPSWRTRSGRR